MDKLERMERAGKQILQILTEANYKAYFVGGYVRDKLTGRNIEDIDIATSATPEEVMKLFPNHVPTGLQHGTITVIFPPFAFEVTTFRKESDYVQFRRPDKVEFVDDLREDLQRRDFTINAMALGLDGKLLDPFGGQSDLHNRILRCVGVASERLREDALRMMRCIRFAAEYELDIDESTWNALLRQRANLKHIAMERKRAEFERMIEGRHPARALRLLNQSGLLSYFNVELKLPFQRLQSVAEEPALLENLHDLKNDVRWCALFWLWQITPAQCKASMRLLTFPNWKIAQTVSFLSFNQHLRNHSLASRETWIEAILHYGVDSARNWLHVMNQFQAGASLYRINGRNWLEQMSVYKVTDLKINGVHLRSINIKSGPWIGAALDKVLYATATGTIQNDLQEQLEYAKKVINDEQTKKH